MKKMSLLIASIFFLVSLLLFIPYIIICIHNKLYLHPDISYIVQNGSFYLLFENESLKEINYYMWVFLIRMDKIFGYVLLVLVISSYFVLRNFVFPYLKYLFNIFYNVYTTDSFKTIAFKVSLMIVIGFISFAIVSSIFTEHTLGLSSSSDKYEHYESNEKHFIVNKHGNTFVVNAISYNLFIFIIKPLYHIIIIPFPQVLIMYVYNSY